MLLAKETGREMAKQAKAMKDVRRAALDLRHRYLISMLADALTLEESEVEDALISDEKVIHRLTPYAALLRSYSVLRLYNSCLILPVQYD